MQSPSAPSLDDAFRQSTAVHVSHNVEMAHRLSLTPGKCQQIHGHSWWITLDVRGPMDQTGMVVDFGDLKQQFRQYLDTNFDHRLLLNRQDPLMALDLPGAVPFDGDPTVEEIARHLHGWVTATVVEPLGLADAYVTVWETKVNAAAYGCR